MNTKFNTIIKMLYIPMVISLINIAGVCTGNTLGAFGDEKKPVGTNGATSKKSKDWLCPYCEKAVRNLETLSDKDKTIVLICGTCSVIWDDPNKLECRDEITYEELAKKLGVKNSEELFQERSSHPTTETEIIKTKWKGFNFLLKNNE